MSNDFDSLEAKVASLYNTFDYPNDGLRDVGSLALCYE